MRNFFSTIAGFFVKLFDSWYNKSMNEDPELIDDPEHGAGDESAYDGLAAKSIVYKPLLFKEIEDDDVIDSFAEDDTDD